MRVQYKRERVFSTSCIQTVFIQAEITHLRVHYRHRGRRRLKIVSYISALLGKDLFTFFFFSAAAAALNKYSDSLNPLSTARI